MYQKILFFLLIVTTAIPTYADKTNKADKKEKPKKVPFSISSDYSFRYGSIRDVVPSEMSIGKNKVAIAGGSYLRVFSLGIDKQETSHKIASEHVAISPDDKHLAVASKRYLEIYEIDGETLKSIYKNRVTRYPIENLTFSSQGHIAASAKHQIAIYSLHSKKGQIVKTKNRTLGLAFGPNASWLAYSDSKGGVTFYNLSDKDTFTLKDKFLRSVKLSSKAIVSQIVFAPNEETVAFAYADKPIISIWNWKKREWVKKLTGHKGSIQSLSFHSRSQYLLSASSSTNGIGPLVIWDLENDLKKALKGIRLGLYGASFAKDDRTIYSTSRQFFRSFDVNVDKSNLSQQDLIAELKKEEQDLVSQLKELREKIQELESKAAATKKD